MALAIRRVVNIGELGEKVVKDHRKGFWVVDKVMSLNLNVGYMGSFCL